MLKPSSRASLIAVHADRVPERVRGDNWGQGHASELSWHSHAERAEHGRIDGALAASLLPRIHAVSPLSIR